MKFPVSLAASPAGAGALAGPGGAAVPAPRTGVPTALRPLAWRARAASAWRSAACAWHRRREERALLNLDLHTLQDVGLGPEIEHRAVALRERRRFADELLRIGVPNIGAPW